MSSANDRLRLALSSNDLRQCNTILQELRTLPDDERNALLPDLRAALTHADSLIRCRAIRAVSGLQPELTSCVPLVLDRLRDPSWPVREAAAETLSQPGMTWPGFREALLVTVLHDPQKLVRQAGALALANHPEESLAATEQLLEALKHPHVNVRARALLALGQLSDHAALSVPHIREELHASHWRIRLSAAEALGELGSAAVSAAPDLLRRTFDGHPRVSSAAADALRPIQSALPSPLNEILGFFAWGQGTPNEKLQQILGSSVLPKPVLLAMQATIQRRLLWRQQGQFPADEATRTQEQVWLLAHLIGLLSRPVGI